MKLFQTLIGAGIAFMLLSLSGARAVTWPMEGQSAAHGYASVNLLPSPLAMAWIKALPPGVRGLGFAEDARTLCIVGGALSDPPSPGPLSLYAFSLLDDAKSRTISLGNGYARSPALWDGKAYVARFVPPTQGFLTAFSLDDGHELWSEEFAAEISASQLPRVPSPLIEDGKVWLPGPGGRILRWDAETGSPLDPINAAPAGTEESVAGVSASDQGVYAALSRGYYGAPRQGTAWSIEEENALPLPPVLVGPYLYLLVRTGGDPAASRLLVVHSDTSRYRWSAALPYLNQAAADADTAVVAEANGYVRAFDPVTSFLLWERKSPVAPSGLLLSGDRVAFGDAAGNLHLLQRATGGEVWSFPTGMPSGGGPAGFDLLTSDDVGSSGANEAMLYALRDDGLAMAFRYGVYGDLNGDGRVDVSDATLALRIAVGLAPLTPELISVGDVSPVPGANRRPLGNGKIDVSDALSILRRAVGLPPPTWPFPPEASPPA